MAVGIAIVVGVSAEVAAVAIAVDVSVVGAVVAIAGGVTGSVGVVAGMFASAPSDPVDAGVACTASRTTAALRAAPRPPSTSPSWRA